MQSLKNPLYLHKTTTWVFKILPHCPLNLIPLPAIISRLLEKTQSKRPPPNANFPTFDVVLPDIIEVSNKNHGAQSLLRILEFRLDGDLGEGKVIYIREEDEDTEVSDHSNQIDEAVDANKPANPSGYVPLPCKRIRHKRKGMQLMLLVNLLQSYKRRKVGDSWVAEDFFIALDLLRIIPDPNVAVFVDVMKRCACWPR